MPDPNDQPGGSGGSGGGTPPAPPAKSLEERFAELETVNKKSMARLQATEEELKRVSNLNGVLMQRLQPGNGNPPAAPGGMDARNTVKLKRDFSKLDPMSDPAGFAQELIAETADHVAETISRSSYQQREAENLRRSFYENNKDLVGWERVVGSFSEEVQRENPGLPFDQAASIIAQKTRDFVKSKGQATPPNGNPPSIIPSGSQPGHDGPQILPPKGAGSEAFNPDQAYEDDMKDYLGERNKERDRTTAGKAKS